MQYFSRMFPLDILTQLENRGSLTALVHQAIRTVITTRKLPAGGKLSVPDLARRLKVSRTPVKEALTRLEQEGLVTTIPNRGQFVVLLEADDAREIYQVREMLEGLVAHLAAAKADAGAIRALRRLLQAQEKALRSSDLQAIMRVDMEFHRRLRGLSGNGRAAALLQNLQDQIRIVFATSITIPGRREKAIAEHRRILAAIQKGDPDAAEQAAREHIRNIREAVLAWLAMGRDGGPPGTYRGGAGPAVARPAAGVEELLSSHTGAAYRGGSRPRATDRRKEGRPW